jgi:hypothetical protein
MPGDRGRRMSSRPPPPVQVLGADEGRQPRPYRAWDARVEARVATLRQAAKESGKDVDHCLATPECHGLSGCACNCEPCVRLADLEECAYREVKGS